MMSRVRKKRRRGNFIHKSFIYFTFIVFYATKRYIFFFAKEMVFHQRKFVICKFPGFIKQQENTFNLIRRYVFFFFFFLLL